MSEFTKGPWWIGIETDQGEVEVVSDDRPYICMVLPGAIGGRTLANARLIASAPDLLEALRYARRFLNSEDHDTAYVDAAITRATGSQP